MWWEWVTRGWWILGCVVRRFAHALHGTGSFGLGRWATYPPFCIVTYLGGILGSYWAMLDDLRYGLKCVMNTL